MSYKLNYPRPVSVAARGQKRTLQLVTHIPNESHRLGAPIALPSFLPPFCVYPYKFVQTNISCHPRSIHPIRSRKVNKSRIRHRGGSIFAPLTCCPHRSLCDVYRKGWRKKGTARSVDRCEERCRAKNRCSRTTTTRRTRSNGDETRHPRMLSHLVIRETPALACVFSKDAADPMRLLRCRARRPSKFIYS